MALSKKELIETVLKLDKNAKVEELEKKTVKELQEMIEKLNDEPNVGKEKLKEKMPKMFIIQGDDTKNLYVVANKKDKEIKFRINGVEITLAPKDIMYFSLSAQRPLFRLKTKGLIDVSLKK